MTELKITKEQTAELVSKVKKYFNDELDHEIGGFEAEFLIDFFVKEVGPHSYNLGLADAHALFAGKSEELGYLIQELEKPIV